MADITTTAIAAIHARIDTELAPATLPYAIGRKHIRAKATPPRVVWAEARSPILPTKRAGGNPAEIAIDAARFEVHIWHTSQENAWLTLCNIMAAARQLYAGSLIRFTGQAPMADQSTAMTPKGEGFVLQVEMRIAVTEFVAPTATLQYFGTETTIQLPGGDELLTIDQFNVFYVGKHGNDAWNGRSHDKAVLTIARAITLASALVPASANRFTVVVLDAGRYTEDITLPSWVSLFAPGAVLDGGIAVEDDSSIVLDGLAYSGAAAAAILQSGGTGRVSVQLNWITAAGSAEAVSTTAGRCELIAQEVTVENGLAVHVLGAAAHMRAMVNRIAITGTGSGLAIQSATTLVATVGSIEDAGAGRGLISTAGTITAQIGYINCQRRWTSGAGSFIDLIVGRAAAGVEANIGTLRLSMTGQARAPVKEIDQTDSPYTGLEDDEVIYYATGAASVFNFPAGIRGKHYKICNVGTFPITANGDGGELVFGAASQIIGPGEVMEAHYSPARGWF